jgi:hypothetical protein
MSWYLLCWVFAMTIAGGAVLWLAIDHLIGARWSAALRPRVELVTRAVLPLAILFVPLAILAPDVWPWVHPTGELVEVVAHKHAWLSWPAFVVRSVVYLAVLTLAGWQLRRTARPRTVAAAWILPVGLAIALGGVDWVMTLDPAFASSDFGLYVLTGGVTAALAIVAILTRQPARELARILLVCVLAWGYFAYTQAVIIGMGDLPHDTHFFQMRPHALALAVTAVQCFLPALLLAPGRLIVRPRYLAAVGVVLVAAHALDLYFLVMP